MKNFFKLKSSKEEEKAKEKKSIFKTRNSQEESLMKSEKPAGEYFDNDDELGYC